MIKGFTIVWFIIALGIVAGFADLATGKGHPMSYLAMSIWFGIALALTVAVIVLSRREDTASKRD